MFLLINKPADWTSFDVVAYVRNKEAIKLRKEGEKKPKIKVGHAGTLDPFATGLLIIGVGRDATKRLDEFKNLKKTYVATIHLGAVSDTGDKTGRIYDLRFPISDLEKSNNYPNHKSEIINHTFEIPSLQAVKAVSTSFLGKQLQTPPMFSAKKINGQRLYKLARQGKEVERQPSEIEILDIKMLEYVYPILKIEATCSAGTYIRTLAEDIGKKLGVGAYCEELARTQIGEYKLEDAQNIDKILKNF